MELHEIAGGETGLRALLVDFYDRVTSDVMIGFFFKGKDKERLVQKELELALGLFGADVEYTGKPIRDAHAAHLIMGGQFNRRTQILRETMADHGLPEEVQRRWLEHTESLRAQVTTDRGGECKPQRAPDQGS
jgi:hemoglobin